MANLNFNKVILGGRMTVDPELKSTPSGILVTSFGIAINRRGSKNNEADFLSCVAFRETARHITQYFRKGSSICVVGSLQRRSWTDKQGDKHYITEVVVDEAYFVDSKSNGKTAEAPINKEAIEQAAHEAGEAFDDSGFEVMVSDVDPPF